MFLRALANPFSLSTAFWPSLTRVTRSSMHNSVFIHGLTNLALISAEIRRPSSMCLSCILVCLHGGVVLQATGQGGDKAGPEGYSELPGNTNAIVLQLEPYAKALETSGGHVPEFINPKFKVMSDMRRPF